MRILVLNGSYRAEGGTAAMVEAFCAGAREARHHVDVVNVARLNVHGCRGCEYCHSAGGGVCVQHDDMDKVHPLWDAADMIVVASPVYYGSFSGQMHTALNRTYAGLKPKRCTKMALMLCSGPVASTLMPRASIAPTWWIGLVPRISAFSRPPLLRPGLLKWRRRCTISALRCREVQMRNRAGLAICVLVLVGALTAFGCASSSAPAASEAQPSGQGQLELQADSERDAESTSVEGAPETPDAGNQGEAMSATKVTLEVNGQTLVATLEDNPSAEAFADLLAKGPLTVEMDDYANMEKVGRLPQSLPRSDSQISVGPGDVILYQGSQITVYYDTNSWNFTRLAHIEGATANQMRAVLGDGAVDVTFSLA